jgi:hypothetical protein
MFIGAPAARILGLAALIMASGCGSGSGRPASPPPAAPSARIPTDQPRAVPAAAPEDKIIEFPPDFVPLRREAVVAPVRAPAVATGDPELDPLVSYLRALFAAAIKDGHKLVIMDRTDMAELYFVKQPYQEMLNGLLSDARDQVPAEMIRDFCEKNRESRMVWPELIRHLPASLLTAGERKAIFSVSSDDVWKPFYTKYPGSPGIITVSRVGLNRDKTLAIFYVGNQRHLLLGEGQLHVLKKEGDVWVELPILIGPSWNS